MKFFNDSSASPPRPKFKQLLLLNIMKNGHIYFDRVRTVALIYSVANNLIYNIFTSVLNFQIIKLHKNDI